jgi:hypothetical protein
MPRTLSLLFPNGHTEFWLTERTFEVGEKITRNGRTWVITSLGNFNRDGKALTVTLGVDAPSLDVSLGKREGMTPPMTDHIEDNDLEADEPENDRETDDAEVDRAPQPGNTPAPDEPPRDSGAVTGGRLADDR